MAIQILDSANTFLEKIPVEAAAKIHAHLKALQRGQTGGLIIKVLKGKIREIIVGQYRAVFFFIDTTGYVVDIFKKQSKKTPKRIIERAEAIYKNIENKYKSN